jgi:hypothetical protein
MGVVAHIKNDVVEQVSVPNADPAEQASWEQQVKAEDPEIRLVAVEEAGIGWTLYPDGSVRPEPPYPSWVWGGSSWEAPYPMPGTGMWYWNEDEQQWVRVGGPQITGTTL